MTTSEPNARRYSRRCRQRRMARRRNAMVIMAILAVLTTVFALGYAVPTRRTMRSRPLSLW